MFAKRSSFVRRYCSQGVFLIAALCTLMPAWALDLSRQMAFAITPQKLATALLDFSHQAQIQIVVGPELGDRNSDGLNGTFTIADALSRLLAASGLKYRVISDTSISIGADDPGHDQGSSLTPDAQEVSTPPGDSSAPASEKLQKLETVTVTGSRLARTAKEGPQEVQIYTHQQIEQSGQTTVADFLSTVPAVSVGIAEDGYQSLGGGTTVNLHGLPTGSTLVLINGRRVEVNGVQSTFNFFDLNTIPLAAVDRIEVVPEGSSAIYGSDAIAGVINIVLRKRFNGLEANLKYGAASGTDERDASFAAGKVWGKGSASLIVSEQQRSPLLGADRSVLLGPSTLVPYECSPGNVYSVNGSALPGLGSATYAAVPNGFSGMPSLTEFAATAGALNKCSINAGLGVIPQTHRLGLFASGNYELAGSVEAFTELLFSHTQQVQPSGPPGLLGELGYTPYTISASNPFNPFGETVGVGLALDGVGPQNQYVGTIFFRPLVGVRGSLFDRWQWEIAGWDSNDLENYGLSNNVNSAAAQAALNSGNAATALNPFVDGPGGSQQLLQSLLYNETQHFSGQTLASQGFIRGPVLHMASGDLDVVVGAEYNRDKIYFDAPDIYGIDASFHRDSYAAFGEARIPILANHANPQAGDTLAVTVAGRFDNDDDFGSKTTPQLGGEWRPTETLLIRAGYGRAFKAPSLYQAYSPDREYPSPVSDPLNNNQVETVTATVGGNPELKPETGQSRTFGLVYSSKALPGLQMSLTHWGIDETNSIQQVSAQVLVDNPSLFPGAVVRGPEVNGQPGIITAINDTYVNFGEINVAGFDYDLSYRYRSDFGELTPSLRATDTYHYTAALVPGAAPTDRTSKANDDGNFAPRWKGTLALGWKLGPYTAAVDGRYVGRYQDYDSTTDIGNFWLYDANFRYAIGQALAGGNYWLKGAYIELGGVNLFNSLPQHSNYEGGALGYDPTQGDIRGRFLYAQAGLKL